MKQRRFTRLTNGFSRKFANHNAVIGLYVAHYNWVQRHGTIKTTPAVAAGVADHRWTTRELIERSGGRAVGRSGGRAVGRSGGLAVGRSGGLAT